MITVDMMHTTLIYSKVPQSCHAKYKIDCLNFHSKKGRVSFGFKSIPQRYKPVQQNIQHHTIKNGIMTANIEY